MNMSGGLPVFETWAHSCAVLYDPDEECWLTVLETGTCWNAAPMQQQWQHADQAAAAAHARELLDEWM